MRAGALAWAFMVVLTGQARAQADCFPSRDSHEAQTFGILSVPLAFSAAGTAMQGMAAGLEVASIPEVPAEIATPTTCRPGKGPENTNPLPGFVRVRVEVSLGAWRFDAGWIPPVRVEGVRSNLVGIGVSRSLALGAHWRLAPRVHAVVGRVRGPFTCNAEALQDVASECSGGTLSNDRWDPNILGAEATLSRHGGRVVPHLGLGWSSLRPRFQVGFTNAGGEVDQRKVEVDLQRMAVFAGASARLAGVHLSGEGYATIGDRVAGRMVVRLPLQGEHDDVQP